MAPQRDALTPSRGSHPLRRARRELARRDPLWPEQLTVGVAIALSLLLPEELTIGPTWLLPAFEAAIFAGLVATTPRPATSEQPRRRHVRIGLVTTMSAGNAGSLFLLARYGIEAQNPNGRSLLVGGIVLWVIAVLVFAMWFWELDRGGPVERQSGGDGPDFVFPQMQEDRWTPPDWLPALPDYLYLSLVNATTFGPPEGYFPLTHVAKLMMGLQSIAALATDTLIIARSVNVLG
ncbi:MAG TPA: hypothetical protein VF257_14565 [Solirubrobacteraceae bacterium]